MTIKCNQGFARNCKTALHLQADAFHVGLYGNNVDIGWHTALADLALLDPGPPFAVQATSWNNWFEYLADPRALYILFPSLVFTAAAGGLPVTVYGWVAYLSSGAQLFGELLPGGPQVISAAGQQVYIAPSISFRSEF